MGIFSKSYVFMMDAATIKWLHFFSRKLPFCCSNLLSRKLRSPAKCTEVHFASFLSGGFTTMAVINPLERKLAKHISVKWDLLSDLDQSYWSERIIAAAYKCTTKYSILKNLKL